MKTNPLVSIITVVYNGASTIEQTIQSVINQTYKNIEYIIIDGKSTDGTQSIVNKYMDRIAYFVSEEDKGLYDAMNKGICHASGDIIGIINSDDWYEQGAVSKVVETFISNDDTSLVYGDVLVHDKDRGQRLVKPQELKTMWYQMAMSHPTVFIRKAIYEKHGLFDLQCGIIADYELVLRLYSRKAVFRYIADVLAHFRLGGLSQIYFYECKQGVCDIAYRYIDLCPQKEQILPLLEYNQNWLSFEVDLTRSPEMLEKLISNHFGKSMSDIVIFGAGYWGRKCCEVLLETGIEVSFIVDNNPDCAGEIYDRSIRRADSLMVSDTVLIAVKEQTEPIEEQLNMLGISEHVSIGGLMREYLSN